ncbi:MAG: glycosyltransferase [Candidatus Thorarchaeota archaeon]
MKILLLSDPNSIHTRNWFDGLVSSNIVTDVLYVRGWGHSCIHGNSIPEEHLILLDKPGKTALIKGTVKHGEFGKLIRDLKARTTLHQSLVLLGREVGRIAEERGYDMIHAHGAATSALLAFSSRFRPYSVSTWGSDIYLMPDTYSYLRPLISEALSNAAFVHVESQISAQRVEELTGTKRHDFLVSTWGVDTSRFTPGLPIGSTRRDLSIPHGRMILSLRSLEPLYRIDSIIRAFSMIADTVSDAILVIASSGQLRNELEDLAGNLGIHDRVVFTGFIESEQKRILLSNSYAYVQFPSSDGVALAMMEAMSSGLPLISSNVGETSVLIESESNGLLVEDDSSEALAQAMTQILNDDLLRNRMSQRSRRLALEKHNRSNFFRKFVTKAETTLKT